jgi:hypothetical protein
MYKDIKNFIRNRKKFSLWAISIIQSGCALPFLSAAYFSKQRASCALMSQISNTVAYQNFVTLKVFISDASTCMSQINSIKRTTLFWVIMQRIVVIPYRYFSTTYQSNLQDPWRRDWSTLWQKPEMMHNPIYNGPTNAFVCIKTLIQMSHTKTFKITPTCFEHQMIIIRELFDPG